MYKLRLIALAIVAVMTLALGGTAYADDLHLCDVSTGCSSSSLIGIPSGTTTVYVTGKSVSNETLWLAILSPLPDNLGNFNGSSNTTMWSTLNLTCDKGNCDHTLASSIDQEFGATGITATSFGVSLESLGTWLGGPTTAEQITLPPGGSYGTIYVGFTEDANGGVDLWTPWSSSLVNAPEPSTLTLLAGSLIGLALLGRKTLLA
jgi:hypothetical protein